jgi:hypothetical protein
MHFNQKTWLNTGVFLTTTFFSLNLLAAMPESAYLDALRIAEKSVLRKKNRQMTASALSSPLLKTLFGRYYQVGDKWTVAAWIEKSTMMRMTGDANQLKNNVSNGGIFHYEVLSVKSGLSPQVTIQVTQTQWDGFPLADPKVSRLVLTMNDQLVQSKKSYYFKGSNQEVPVSPDGIHSSMTPLELYPLDITEFSTAEKNINPSIPQLPSAVQTLASRVGFKPDLSQCVGIDTDDFFGRPIQVLWQHGKPWPSYFKTPGGVAILIPEGAL